jgi:hypothetical protein
MIQFQRRLICITLMLCILFNPLSFVRCTEVEDLHVTIQPDLSNNISIMRNNDDASIEQPTVVTSGYRTDQKYPSDERALLKFDLVNLPKGYHVRIATLSLYVIGVYTWDGSYWKPQKDFRRTIELHAITTDWMGWSFTYWTYATFPRERWKTAGGDFAPLTDSVNRETPGTWNNWTVTKDVEAWYSGEKPNYGWLLKDAEEGDKVGCRVEYMNWFYVYDISYSPKLEVTLESGSVVSFPHLEWIVVTIVAICLVAIVAFRSRWKWLNRAMKQVFTAHLSS